MTGEVEGKSGSGCVKIGLWIVAAFVGLVFLGAVIGGPKKDGDAESDAEVIASSEGASRDSSTESLESEPADVEPQSNWSEFEREDELRGTTDKFAVITSNNSVDFDFPYCCNSKLEITVRQTSQYGKDVIFQISDGQFVCGIYDCSGMISIDGEPERLSLGTPADHDSKVLFARYPEAIIRKLKNSERVIVELPFYQEGNRQFTFDTAGLKFE